MKLITSAGFFFLFVLVGCTNKLTLDENSVPQTLLIGVYVSEGPEATMDRLTPVQKYLESKLKIPVELIKAADYTAVIEALRAKKIHMAYLPPFAYVLAAEKIEMEVLVTLGVNGKPYNYQSIIVTSKNSGLKTMDDVKANAKNLTLGFSDPASASGHLIPRAYLHSIGLDPKASFKDTLFASGHTASLMAAKTGKVDVACTALLLIKMLLAKDLIKHDDMVVLWTSDPIVSDPIVIRRDINKEFAEKVKQAYLDLPSDAPETLSSYLTKLYVKGRMIV